MKKTLIISMAFSALFIYSCSKSSEDTVGGGGNTPPPEETPGTCDTANMKYTANVVPILSANCYSCHGTNSNSGSQGIVLEGYQNIKPNVDGGILIGVITHAPGFPPMPNGGGKLSDCDINKIRSWINNGAQNN